MDVEGAKKMLAAAPVMTETKGNPLAGAMANVKNPNPGAAIGAEATDEATEIAAINAAAKAARGGK